MLLVRTRYVVLWLIRQLGRVCRYLNSGWRHPVFWMTVIALGVWLAKRFFNLAAGTWLQWWIIPILYLVLVLPWWAWQAHKRIVVEEFVDHTSDQSKSVARGLSTLLVVELVRLRDLYADVDEQRAVSTATTRVYAPELPIDAAVNVEDVSEFLKGAVTTESQISLGPLKIPVGFFIALIGRLVRAPRIAGSLHKDKDRLILIAQTAGGKQRHSWRIDDPMPLMHSMDQGNRSLDDMVTELACRMFTDMTLSGSVRWRARWEYNEALRAYRNCLRTSNKQNLKLAERGFLKALAEDNKFAFAYYNLGVLYTELGQRNKAEVAFLKAIDQNHELFEAYYALALYRYKDNDYKDNVYKYKDYKYLIQLCDRVIDRKLRTNKPTRHVLAMCYNLKGLAQRFCDSYLFSFDNISESDKDRLRRFLKDDLFLGWVEDVKIPEPDDHKTIHIRKDENSVKITINESDEKPTLEIGGYGFLEGISKLLLAPKIPRIFRFKSLFWFLYRTIFNRWTVHLNLEKENGKLSIYRGDPKYLKGAIKSRKKAVAKSWKALCMAELGWESSIMLQLKRDASLCLGNLAVAYAYHADKSRYVNRWFAFVQAKSVFRKALSVTRSNAELHFELGKTYDGREKHDRAAKEYNSAIRIDPTNSEFQAHLALAYAKQEKKDLALLACEKVLNCASGSSDEALDETAKAYRELSKLGQSRRVVRMKTFLREVEEDRNNVNAETLLKEKLKQYNQEGQEWECAQVAVVLGCWYLDSRQPEDAEKCFKKAIDKFEGKHQEEIRWHGLQGLLVRSLLDQGKHTEAMQAVEKALTVDPLNSFERSTLGDVYLALDDFEQARAAWEEALFLEPDNPGIHFNIGLCYQKRAANQRKTTGRDTALQQAVKYLNQSLDLYDESNLKDKGQAHYTLGSVYVDLSEYEKAIYHLRIAQKLGFTPLTTTLELGRAYLKNMSYDKCVEQFDQLINEAPEAKKKRIANVIIAPESISLDELFILACLYKAFSYAERDVNLEEALKLAKHAEDYIDKLDDATVKERCQAAHADCKGWILYKQDCFDEAIEYLERAVSLAAAAGAYLRLALACERKFQKCEDKEKCQSLIMQAQAYCQHARQLDFNNEYSKRVNDLLLRLREKKRR